MHSATWKYIFSLMILFLKIFPIYLIVTINSLASVDGCIGDLNFFLAAMEKQAPLPPPLTIRNIPLTDGELEKVGTLIEGIKQRDYLRNLPDGTYIYITFRHNGLDKTLIANRVPDISVNPQIEDFLATHRGLLNQMFELFGRDSSITLTGAGEVVRNNGKVSAINNRSGTLWPDTAHLDYSTQVLKNAGLEVIGSKSTGPITDLVDFSTIGRQRPSDHLSATKWAKLYITYHTNDRDLLFLKALNAIEQEMSLFFPHPEIVGRLQIKPMIDYLLQIDAGLVNFPSTSVQVIRDALFLLGGLQKEGAVLVMNGLGNKEMGEIALILQTIRRVMLIVGPTANPDNYLRNKLALQSFKAIKKYVRLARPSVTEVLTPSVVKKYLLATFNQLTDAVTAKKVGNDIMDAVFDAPKWSKQFTEQQLMQAAEHVLALEHDGSISLQSDVVETTKNILNSYFAATK